MEEKASKRWDPYLGAWVVDLPKGYVEVEIELKGQRVKTDDGWKFFPYKRPDFAKDEEVSSCEISSKGRTHTPTTVDPQWQVEPWEGLDKTKWRNTFLVLVQLHSASDWHTQGLYISAKEYRDRIHNGIYAPENRPKPWHSHHSHSKGYKRVDYTAKALEEKHGKNANISYGEVGYWVGNQFFPYEHSAE